MFLSMMDRGRVVLSFFILNQYKQSGVDDGKGFSQSKISFEKFFLSPGDQIYVHSDFQNT